CRSTRFRAPSGRATSWPGSSFTSCASRIRSSACIWSATWANGGSVKPACRFRSAPSWGAASSARATFCVPTPPFARRYSGRAHPAPARAYVRSHAQELDQTVIDAHIALYVNEFSIDLGETGRAAVRTFFERASAAGLSPAVDEDPFVV